MTELAAPRRARAGRAGRREGSARPEGWAAELERHRVELTGYCYRMLGSPFDAEDAVQETLARAWRNLDRFDQRRAPLRAWLYAIATNTCLDLLRGRRRRAHPVDLGPSTPAGGPLGVPLAEDAWVQPVPDGRVLAATGDPAELAVARETVRLAFVAALQYLPPRQRAVLILRDVLCWRADEVARLLDSTVPAVNSALQRARATLAAVDPSPTEPFQPMDREQRRLLARYADAFERDDVDTLVSLLHQDATMSMPPFTWWLRGRTQIRRALLGSGGACSGSLLVPTVANGSPAFGQYRPSPSGPAGRYEPWALVVVEVAGGQIVRITSYLAPAALFPLFGLPPLPLRQPR